MDLKAIKQVILRTHLAAIEREERANAIALESGPGVGKSDTMGVCAHDLAQILNEPVGFVSEMFATLQSVDVRGFMMPAKAAEGSAEASFGVPRTVFSIPPWYPVKGNMVVYTPDGSRYAEGEWEGEIPRVGILALDEFGQAEIDVQKAAAELLLHGRVGHFSLPPLWRVVAASNRLSDRAGVLKSLTFLTNRRMLLRVDASLPAWNEWVNNQPEHVRPHHLTISFANRQPDLVFRDSVPAGDDPFCTPRTLVRMDRDLQALATEHELRNNTLPMDQVAREVCAGWIGGGESAQFFTHIKFAEEIPDLADIERDPHKAKLPEKRDAQMVCAFMLAHNITQKNVVNILRYIDRMNIEMGALAVHTITQQQDKAIIVANTPEFGQWLTKNQRVLTAARG